MEVFISAIGRIEDIQKISKLIDLTLAKIGSSVDWAWLICHKIFTRKITLVRN